MIIRKPYAFLLKHFKLIHFLLAMVMLYVLYKTSLIATFFSDYFANGENVMGQEITNGLYGIGIYFSVITIIIGVLIVLFLMFNKKKPVKYYALVIVSYIAILIFLNFNEGILNQMEISQLSARTVKAFSDITIITIFVQVLYFLPALVRGIGFNIKQFDFDKDLIELDITEEDREEVEIGFGVDSGKFKRKIRKNIRYIKYGYQENKLFANVAIVIGVVLIGYFGYKTFGFNEKKYEQGEHFNTTTFNMMIQDSYIVDNDYKQKKIPQGKTLVVLRLQIRNLYNTPTEFELGRAELNVGGNKYHPTKEYKNELVDLGNTYDGNKITTEEQFMILTYVVPSNYLDKKMQFHYVDQIDTFQKKVTTTYMKVKINPIDLRTKAKEKKYNLGDTIEFNNPITGKGNLKIQSYDINAEYQLSYNYCAKKGQCQVSFEYIKPNILTNQNKALLKINYQYQNENKWTNKLSSIFNSIRNFATIKYKIDGKMKEHSIELTEIKPKKASAGNNIYIEVLEEVKNAEAIDLEFYIRNQKYSYKLK